ncbi:hypothetical protein C0995_014522 [Termitomyces sp. Mi166|nr:hypothetical protein C0995_014522 [Termitomyces sp. Mi166\
MVRRSKTAPLTIAYQRFLYHTTEFWMRSYTTLTEILRSHISRIKSLTLDSRHNFSYTVTIINSTGTDTDRESAEILALLNRPAPMIERLDIRLPSGFKKYLPNKLFVMPSRLQHLILEGYGMTWDPELVDFRNLRSLQLCDLSKEMNPSMTQLLAILRQTSRLESLELKNNHELTNVDDSYPLQVIDPINLGHLEQIRVSGNLSDFVLLNHIIFSKNARFIHLCINNIREIPASLAQTLAAKIDNGIEGSILTLSLSGSIRCWKSKDTTKIPLFHDLPTISVRSSRAGHGTCLVNTGYFWRTLRLDQLVSLEIETFVNQDSWTFFGDLPHLQTLQVWSNETRFLRALNRGLDNESKADTPPVRLAFAALRNLTMLECTLNRAANIEDGSNAPLISVMHMVLSCFELRKKAGVPLDSLRLADCNGVYNAQVERLRDFVKQVQWDGFGDMDNENAFGHDYEDFDPASGYLVGDAQYEDEEMDEDLGTYHA